MKRSAGISPTKESERNMDETSQKLINAMAKLEEADIISHARELIQSGISSDEIQQYLNEGMKQVGDFFEAGEYFIADLMVSGVFYRLVLDMLPIPVPGEPQQEKIMIGVVEKDLHDIGKDIVVATLEANGYQVIDLGIDVSAEQFVEAVRKEKPHILLLSGMLSLSRTYMKETIDALAEAGLRENLYVIVGGGCITSAGQNSLGADAAANNLTATINYCNTCLKDKKSHETN